MSHRSLMVAFAVASAIQPAMAQVPALADLPAAIRPPEGLAVYVTALATGVQIYTCGKNPAGAWTWIFKAPEAALTNPQKKPLGKHYAGPTWEGLDGGKVVGAVKASVPSPSGSIPWLLLDIKSREGSGAFTAAQNILRVATRGGTAPVQGCDAAHSGAENRVPYTAAYLFLK
ncbi:MAG: DUF3455 domain-containing protein [Xanthobacteraceae bacterium]